MTDSQTVGAQNKLRIAHLGRFFPSAFAPSCTRDTFSYRTTHPCRYWQDTQLTPPSDPSRLPCANSLRSGVAKIKRSSWCPEGILGKTYSCISQRGRGLSARTCAPISRRHHPSVFIPPSTEINASPSPAYSLRVCIFIWDLMTSGSPPDTPTRNVATYHKVTDAGVSPGNWEWAESEWGAYVGVKIDRRLIQRQMPHAQHRLRFNEGAHDGGKCKMSSKKWIQHKQDGWRIL